MAIIVDNTYDLRSPIANELPMGVGDLMLLVLENSGFTGFQLDVTRPPVFSSELLNSMGFVWGVLPLNLQKLDSEHFCVQYNPEANILVSTLTWVTDDIIIFLAGRGQRCHSDMTDALVSSFPMVAAELARTTSPKPPNRKRRQHDARAAGGTR